MKKNKLSRATGDSSITKSTVANVYMYMQMRMSNFCGLLSYGFFWILCASYVGLLNIARHSFMHNKVFILAALTRVASSYLRVCRDGIIPAGTLLIALKSLSDAGLSNILLLCAGLHRLLLYYGIIWASDMFLTSLFLCPFAHGPGKLLLGSSGLLRAEDHLSLIGKTIRMVLSNFTNLKRCPHRKELAFSKADFKFGTDDAKKAVEAVLAEIHIDNYICGCKLCNPRHHGESAVVCNPNVSEKSECTDIVPYDPHHAPTIPDCAITAIAASVEPRGGDIFEDCNVLKALCVCLMNLFVHVFLFW